MSILGDKIKPFKLREAFLAQYKGQQPAFGSLGYFTFKRTYSRELPDGSTEEFWQMAQRVVEGSFTILKWHYDQVGLPWDDDTWMPEAEQMFRKIWELKFLPAGRGMWLMGTDFMYEHGSAGLCSCAFVSTKNIDKEFAEPFCWAMEASTLGIGCGFDVDGSKKDMIIKKPDSYNHVVHVVEDSREGWVDSLRVLLNAYLKGLYLPRYDYSKIRPKGTPLKSFGGRASGPGPLITMHEDLVAMLDASIGKPLDSEHIADIFNMIGRCIVSGNIRRCLPEYSLVHSKGGLKPIKDIEVGDEILTTSGYKKVLNKFDQGIQDTVFVKTQDGLLECTENHRIAVLDSVDTYKWIEAKNLKTGDRIISTRESLQGQETFLPVWTYNKEAHSTTCQDIVIPTLDEDMAWFLGIFQADGYTYPNYENNGFNAHIAICLGENEYAIAEKVKQQIERFGLNNVVINHSKDEKSWRIICTSKQLSWYLDAHIKQAKQPLKIPQFILEATESVKLAYICGVYDGDGSDGRPLQIVTSIYKDYVLALQKLLYSCGIESRFSSKQYAKRLLKGWNKLYRLNIITMRSRNKLMNCHYSLKAIKSRSKSQNCNGFPSAWIKTKRRKLGLYTNRQLNIDAYDANFTESKLCPVEVIDVVRGNIDIKTYDLEVETNEFFADGYLVHNSAQIALGDPTDDKFMRLKEDKEKSIAYRWASNNTIKVPLNNGDNKALYEKVVDLNLAGTDVGLVFMDLIRTRGRLIDGFNDDDAFADGINPCQPADALIFDGDRMRYITDQGAKNWTSWKTGEKEVLELTTNTGLKIRCTPDHKVMLKDGSWCEAKDTISKELTQPADRLNLKYDGQEPLTPYDDNEFLRGFLFGDGYLSGKHQGATVKLSAKREPEMAAMLTRHGFVWQPSGSYYRNVQQLDIDVSFLSKRVFDRELPEDILLGNFDKVVSFLAGLFAANGSCNRNGQISLKLTNESAARSIQVLLGALSIHASIAMNPAKTVEWANGTFTSRVSYNLQIPTSYGNIFQTMIGFIAAAKVRNLRPAKNRVHIYVKEIRSLGVMEVWDYHMNEGPNYTYCQGTVLHNCGEQALESYEVCNLVETYPYKHRDIEDYKETLKYAYLYGKIVTLLPTHWKRTNAVMARNRRIGISQSGIVEAMGSIFKEHHADKLDDAYKHLRRLDMQYSHEFIVNRSIRLTTVKPSGTNSLLAGCSPGIHYPHSEYYLRRVRVSDNSHLLAPIRESGFPVEPDIYSPNTMVVSFPVQSVNFSKCKDEITVDEQFSHVRTYQTYWSDNQVSVTITFRPEDKDALTNALSSYEGRFKSVSFLVDGDVYAQAPLEAITEEEYSRLMSDIKPLDLSSVRIGGGGVLYCTNDKCELKL